MGRPIRKSLPDNLDPLVDTLSNVVGILVIVVALTQIQLGDALARVAELDFLRAREERAREAQPEVARDLEARRDALLRRTDEGVEESIQTAQETLAALVERAPEDAAKREESRRRLEAELGEARRRLVVARQARDRRAEVAERLASVPKHLVARLPDPQQVVGRESWILVRYGRVYLVDREELFAEGSAAIQRILADGGVRQFQQEDFEAVARYLRKYDVGIGNFRWQLQTDPRIRVELEWRSKDAGIEIEDLETSEAFRVWLAERSPDVDLVRFQVWSDSFEAYLAAREILERAGFRSGWRSHEADEDFEIRLTFGPPDPDVKPVQVD